MKKLFLFIAFILIPVFFFASQASASDYIKDGVGYKNVGFEVFADVNHADVMVDKLNSWAKKNKFLIIDLKWNDRWLLVVYTKERPKKIAKF